MQDMSISVMPHLDAIRAAQPLKGRRILIIVENLPLPFDRRVWHECRTLTAAGAKVSVICPTGKGYEARHEVLEGVDIYRHPLPLDAKGALGYLLEYSAALFHEMRLALKVAFSQGFDTIQACNPPDLMFLVALPFKLFGKRFVFDHHDINPELFEAKFNKRGLFWRALILMERLTFRTADVVISTNESYREIALTRGNVKPEDSFIVRSGPDLSRLKRQTPDPAWRKGRKHMVGYVGVIGDQEGIELLLETVRIVVRDMGQDVQFVIVGGGPALAGLQDLAARLGVADFVTFTGWGKDDVVFSVLSSADACVGPDRVNAMNDKSTMNKVLEYMAFAKPIVQFDVTEGRRSAREASLYAAANDPADFARMLVGLLDDPERGREMGEFGRKRVETDLSWDHQVDTLIAAYQRVAVKRR